MNEIKTRNKDQGLAEFLESMSNDRRRILQDLMESPLFSKESDDLDTQIDIKENDKPIERTIALFESWKEHKEERSDLERIFRIAFQIDHPSVTEEDKTELLGFVGALRMLGQI